MQNILTRFFLVDYDIDPMLLELVEKILVHEHDVKGSSTCTQEIEINFNFVGRYMPPDFIKEPTPEELAEQEAGRKCHEKRLQAYLHRKESSKVKAYYEARIKEGRKAEIRQEDQEKGIYYVVAECPEGLPTVVHKGESFNGLTSRLAKVI